MTTSAAVLAALSGLGLGLSLIVAIGAQNAFVLRQGLRGEYLATVVMICILSDAALIVAGVLGAGAVLDRVPWLLPTVRLGGAAFLLGYGLIAARRALRPTAALDSETAVAKASSNALLLKPDAWRASREETPCGGLTPMGVHAVVTRSGCQRRPVT